MPAGPVLPRLCFASSTACHAFRFDYDVLGLWSYWLYWLYCTIDFDSKYSQRHFSQSADPNAKLLSGRNQLRPLRLERIPWNAERMPIGPVLPVHDNGATLAFASSSNHAYLSPPTSTSTSFRLWNEPSMPPPSMYRSLRLFASGLIIFCVFSALTLLYGNQQNRIRNLFNLKGNITNQEAAIEFKVRPESLKDITNSTLGVSVLCSTLVWSALTDLIPPAVPESLRHQPSRTTRQA